MWPYILRRGPVAVRLLELRVRIRSGHWYLYLVRVCCTGRGLCVRLITRLEESYRLCVSVTLYSSTEYVDEVKLIKQEMFKKHSVKLPLLNNFLVMRTFYIFI